MLALPAFGQLIAPPRTSAMPLRVHTEQVAHGTVRIALTNTGQKTVTAYALATTTTAPTGSSTHGESSDDYLTADRSPLQPQATVVLPDKVILQADDELVVVVSAIVFADDTALGNPESINAIFANRNEQAIGIGTILQIVRSAHSVSEARAVLDQRRSTLPPREVQALDSLQGKLSSDGVTLADVVTDLQHQLDTLKAHCTLRKAS